MKRKLLLKLTMLGTLLMFLTTQSFAQNSSTTNQVLTLGIPPIALVYAVDSSGLNESISLQLTTNTAGTAITGGTNASFLQLSSIVASGSTNKVQAKIDGVPAGTTLEITASAPNSGNGDGTFGTAVAGPVTLSTTAQDIITGIGSCYTGTAPLDGYGLQWQWNAGSSGSYSSITSTTNFTTTVTLTITAGT